MKIGYVSTYDSSQIGNWSGTGFHIRKTLESHVGVVYPINCYDNTFTWSLKACTFLSRSFMGCNFLRDREPFLLKRYAKKVQKALQGSDVDIVFSPGTIPIAFLESSLPMVFWTDACFAGMVDFYPAFTTLCKRSLKMGHMIDKRVLDKCSLAVYSSKWAADWAIKHYEVDESKVKVIPFGANIDRAPSRSEALDFIEKRPKDVCKLLFIGIDWARKGGEDAYNVAKALNCRGLKTELSIVGCRPDLSGRDTSFVKVYGMLRKSVREESTLFSKLLSETHYMILPTKAEAYGLVFCEANAYAVPCIASDVGGIPTIIRNDVNGRMFPVNASIDSYCEYILGIFEDYGRYKRLAASSFEEYVSRLNWDAAGKSLKKALDKAL